MTKVYEELNLPTFVRKVCSMCHDLEYIVVAMDTKLEELETTVSDLQDRVNELEVQSGTMIWPPPHDSSGC